MVTVTTVGYGDKYPVSAGGRGVAVVLMLVGIGLIGILTATVASYFVEQGDDANSADLNLRLDRIEAMLAGMAAAAEHAPSSPTNLNQALFDSEQYNVAGMHAKLSPTINLAHSVSVTQHSPAPATDLSPSPAAASIADELARLGTLKDSGVLSDEEFEVQKAKLLA
jgi:type II secretory pathway pseudopilin PulG